MARQGHRLPPAGCCRNQGGRDGSPWAGPDLGGRQYRGGASLRTARLSCPGEAENGALSGRRPERRGLALDGEGLAMADSYDLIIIGAGPGGYVAAIRAAQLGLKTAIVEREHMAGICSNWGCIPTKALLRTAEIYGHMAHAKDYGLTAEKFGFDLDATVKRSCQIAAQMNNGVQFLMKKNKVDTIWGEAVLTGPGEIK